MATQNFKRNLPLILYKEGKKYLTLAVCILHLGVPSLPACYPLSIFPHNLIFETFLEMHIYLNAYVFILSN